VPPRARLSPSSSRCRRDGFLGDAVPIARAAFDDNDLITAMREQLYPKFLASAIGSEVVADRVVTGIEDRLARIMVPRRWQPISALRGIVNPLIDRSLERNPHIVDAVLTVADPDEQDVGTDDHDRP